MCYQSRQSQQAIKQIDHIDIDELLVILAKDFKIVQNDSIFMLKYLLKMNSNDIIFHSHSCMMLH